MGGADGSAGFELLEMNGVREIRHLEKAKLKAQKSHNLREEASLCNQLGEWLAKQGEFQKAIEEHKQELHLSEVLDDVIGCAVANRKIGECLAEMGSYTAALEHQRKHLRLACSMTNDVEEQRAWATIGRTYLFIHETDQSGESLQQAENAFRKSLAIVDNKLEGKVSQHELSEMRARLYLNLGFLFDVMKDPLRCNRYIRKSIYIAEQNKLYEDLYRANYNLGCIHFRLGEHTRAVRGFEAAKECARKMKEKFMESECFSNIGQVLLILGDFVAAKRSLKKAFKLGSQHQSDHDSVGRYLKKAVKVCRLEEALSELGEKERQDALGLCEQLGDFCCKLTSYQKAIDYYQMQLRHAEDLRKPDRELAVIHFSLAATFADLNDYEMSLKHYEAELHLQQGNPKEECKTWLKVAMTKEECGRPYGELEQCYQMALRCAEHAELSRLQVRTLKLLHAVQDKNEHPEASLTLTQLQELQQDSESGDESEADERDNSEPMEDSELELSESDDDEMEGYDKSVSGPRKINRWNRRNEKGETVLHRACIDGNLKHVQCLVEKGHPLNPRDYCGWTPLHEACNHGHQDIAHFLVEHGANINDAGGPYCECITPLHDAIACGHFDIARMLVEKGASVTVCNAKGQTPLEGLREWEHLYRRDLDQDTRQECRHLERLLMETLARGGPRHTQPMQDLQESDLFDSESSQLSQPPTGTVPGVPGTDNRKCEEQPRVAARGRSSVSSARTQGRGPLEHSPMGPQELPSTPLACSNQVSTRRGLDWPALSEEGSSEEEETRMERFRPVRKRQRSGGQRSPGDPQVDPWPASVGNGAVNWEEPSSWDGVGVQRGLEGLHTAASTYQQAMQSLGSAKSRLLCHAPAKPAHSVVKPALVPDTEYVGEDWLEDDVGGNQRRKRPRERGRVPGDPSPAETDPGHGDELPRRPSAPSTLVGSGRKLAQMRKRPRQMRMTGMVEKVMVRRTESCHSDGGVAPGSPELGSEVAGHNSSLNTAPVNTQSANTPIRVRVRVLESTFLIPVPHSNTEVHTVSWLEEQATQRYYHTCGLRPKLTLKKEGALLDPQDPIVHVLQSNEEVLADVLCWDLSPLSDRYRKACQSLALAEDSRVLRMCEMQGSTACFRLCNLSLRGGGLTPVLRALRLHTVIRELRLSANRLSDDVMDELLGSLVTMPNLTLLDLSSNQITGQGLRKLSEGARCSTNTPFQNLQELDLSLNPLGEGSCQALALLITACPVLSSLRLQACGLTARLLQHHCLLLSDAMKGAPHLKMVCVSHNPLGAAGVELVLQSLPHHTLTHLDLSAVGGAHGDILRADQLIRYLSQDGCCLTTLNLSANRLTDDSLQDLARGLLLCRSLGSLNLSANAGLTTRGVELLLAAVRERSCGLQFLSVAGASVDGTSNSEVIASKLGELCLCSHQLNKVDKERLMDSWRDALGVRLHTLCRLHKCLLRAVPKVGADPGSG
ncbi:tonsoku-like protein [Narcine bancroftii]|uniref:tonsoku-like protein n=1 Tax=Narcine bancroftii TaxID=1343680 RepID=UPI0038311E69